MLTKIEKIKAQAKSEKVGSAVAINRIAWYLHSVIGLQMVHAEMIASGLVG